MPLDDIEQATLNDESAAVEINQPSMEETIGQAWAEIQARESETESESAADTRARNERGQFSKKSETDPAASEPVPVDQVQAEQAEQSTDANQANLPEWMKMGLRKDEAEAVAQAPKAAQDAFMRRIKETQEGVSRLHEQLGGKAEIGHAFEQALSPFMQTIQQTGLPPAEAVRAVMAAEHGLRYGNEDQKAIHALNVLSSYGINLQKVFAIAAGQYQPTQQPVQVPQQQQQRAPDISHVVAEAVEQRFLEQDIARFAKQPGRDHFNELRPVMASLLDSGAAQSLDDAYDQALRAHPVHGQQWLAKQLADAEAKRKGESARKAQEAKRASAVNVSRRGIQSAAKPVGSMEDTIRDEAQRLGMI